MILDLLLYLWELFVTETAIPDYIIEALNWLSFAFMVFFILSPVLIIWLAMRLFGKAGRYD